MAEPALECPTLEGWGYRPAVPTEVRVGEVSAREKRVGQVGVFEACAMAVRAVEVRAVESRAVESRGGEVQAEKACMSEDCPIKIDKSVLVLCWAADAGNTDAAAPPAGMRERAGDRDRAEDLRRHGLEPDGTPAAPR
jgi:hypothetical protein